MTKREEKQQLRRAIRAAIGSLPEDYCRQASAAICSHLSAMPEYLAAGTVFCFVGTPREIDTSAFLTDTLRREKRLCVPRCVGDGLMELRRVTSLEQLRPGSYGILEPAADAPLVHLDEVDFAVIPCLACDYSGRRLGQGGGYYDRFLTKYRSTAVLVCRERLIRAELPTEPHDCFIPWVLTERGLYEDGVPARFA